MERQSCHNRCRCWVWAIGFAVALAGCASGPEAESDASANETSADGGASSENRSSSGFEGGEDRTPPEGFTDAEVLKVVSQPGGHAVILGDGDDQWVVPIFIGQSQAMAIKLRLQRRRYSRPLTHDLLDTIVAELGGEIAKVHIDAIKSGVFVGTVYVRSEGETHEVDARSSDAIALAVGRDAPIFVAEGVFEKAGVSRDEFDERGLPGRNPYGQEPKKSPETTPDPGESGESEDRPFY